jgi:hypothetical protein
MLSSAHNFHLALYYGISSCKLQGYGKDGVKPISFHQQGKSKTSLESPLINWVGGHWAQ